ncbi:hypothetical protein VTJ04DRAFT_554 [Mycothermus thermophilus]|uniref:uncharacterized protein n=1 Tax=Humicola insolens TaxID=85995 RepID=UPI0037424779
MDPRTEPSTVPATPAPSKFGEASSPSTVPRLRDTTSMPRLARQFVFPGQAAPKQQDPKPRPVLLLHWIDARHRRAGGVP